MEEVLLNSDMLNDTESVYFQIDKFFFIKFKVEETENFLKFFSVCYTKLQEEGIVYNALFMPFNIYNNIICLINESPIFDLLDTMETVLNNAGIEVNNIIVYIPDCLKDQCKIR